MSVKTRFVAVGHMTVLRAIGKDGELRYYKTTERQAAREFDSMKDPITIVGFPVYDKQLSTSYAVALYATFAEADTFAIERNLQVAPALPDPVKADMLEPKKPETYQRSKPK